MIFHCQAKAISRANGRSATAAAAYRAGERIIDDRTGEIHDYRRKRGILHKELVFPKGAEPVSRALLWNMAEAAEKRKDAKVAREWELALPAEMQHQERVALARDFAKALAERYGVVADMCIHAPGKKGDDRNHHAHLLTTTRSYGPKGFGEKIRILDSPKTSGKEVDAVREIWERLCNASLSLVGVKERVDRRTLKAQGISRQPTRHLGPTASAMERRGVRTFRGDVNRRSTESEVVDLEKELADLKKLEGGIEGARSRFMDRKAVKAREEQEQMERLKRGRQMLEQLDKEAKRRREIGEIKTPPAPRRGMER